MKKKKSLTKNFISHQVVRASSLKKEDFFATIEALKEYAAKNGMHLTDTDIARQIGLTADVFKDYMDNNDKVPEDTFAVLREVFSGILKYRVYKIESYHNHPDPYTDIEPGDLED